MTSRRAALIAAVILVLALAAAGAWWSISGAHRRADPPQFFFGRQYTGPGFADVSLARGVDRALAAGSPEKLSIFENVGSGAAILDFDGDVRLDLFFANGGRVENGRPLPGPGAALYRQREDGTFEESSARAGIDFKGWGTGAAVGDIENDGDLDIFLGTLEAPCLFRNDGGRFVECARESGLVQPGFASSAVFLDYDRDGLLDLYVARYVRLDPARPPNGGRPCLERGVEVSCGPSMHEPLPPLLYHNEGSGKFRDATAAAGLGGYEGGYGLGAAAGDLDGDGWTDIYTANDTTANTLWRNRGDGTFEELAIEAGCALSENGQAQAGMGVDLGDANGDGRPEIFVSNYSEEYNSYYANLGQGQFADRSAASGLSQGSFLTLGWGAKFIDYDLDGALDLFIVNGHVHPRAHEINPALSYEQPILFYRGDGSGGFRLDDRHLGADARASRSHRAAAVGDLDSDGALDIVVTVLDARPLVLLYRAPGERKALALRLRGVRSNREGIGAHVEMRAGGRTQHREITRGGGYLSASDAVAHFGLGSLNRAESVTIRWPGGGADELGPLLGGATYLIEEGGRILEERYHMPAAR